MVAMAPHAGTGQPASPVFPAASCPPEHAEIGGREGIGVAQGSHGDHLGGPGPDSRHGRRAPRAPPSRSHPGPRDQSSVGERGDQRGQGAPAGGGSPSIGPHQGSGDGNRWVRPPWRVGTGWPCRATSREAWVRAAAVDTCWPSTARTAISAPSTQRGTRRPGALADDRAESRVRSQLRVDGDRVRVEIEEPSASGDGRGQITQVGEAWPDRRCARVSG